eukprot:1452439-Alexandrium_andersonii.AAC.1
MSASLVGSEMCIRDRSNTSQRLATGVPLSRVSSLCRRPGINGSSAFCGFVCLKPAPGSARASPNEICEDAERENTRVE